ncbi:unnamed protein product [Dicrocoelium dendriticum]|nr:unnamed protein product [Dicrocoelium dendriticum]
MIDTNQPIVKALGCPNSAECRLSFNDRPLRAQVALRSIPWRAASRYAASSNRRTRTNPAKQRDLRAFDRAQFTMRRESSWSTKTVYEGIIASSCLVQLPTRLV